MSVVSETKTKRNRLLEIAGTKKNLVIGAMLFSAVSSLLTFVPFMAIYLLIREVITVLPDLSLLNKAAAMRCGWLALGGMFATVITYYLALVCSHLAAFGTLYQLKVDFASHLAQVPLGFHTHYGSGKIRKVMDENIEKIEGFIAHQLPDLVASFVAPFAMFAILLLVDWRYGLAAIIGILSAFAIQIKAYGNDGAAKMMENYQKSLEDMNNASVEYVRGISVVKAFKQTVYSFQRLHNTIKAYTNFVLPFTMSWENYMSGFMALVNNLYLFIIPVGIWIGTQTQDLKAYALTFIFYLIFVPSVSSIMMKIMYVSTDMMRIKNGIARMDEVLDMPVLSVPDQPQTCSRFDVSFERVSFSYQDSMGQVALDKVSFAAEQGAVTAIVGPSGGGKTTIAHLIPRFFDVTEGAIRIGGIDVRHMAPAYLMAQVSFVFQDVFLFKQSVYDNIRMGNLAASEPQIIAAAKAAQCHEFIEKLPNGYQTIIGTKGIHLSGGEKQRIAIARAIVKNAPIIILDEATAFADPENEHLIQKAFESLMQDKTVIIIAHRLSTIQSANQIIVMDQGRVSEIGTHSELLARRGKYAAMWDTYIGARSWKFKSGKEQDTSCSISKTN